MGTGTAVQQGAPGPAPWAGSLGRLPGRGPGRFQVVDDAIHRNRPAGRAEGSGKRFVFYLFFFFF